MDFSLSFLSESRIRWFEPEDFQHHNFFEEEPHSSVTFHQEQCGTGILVILLFLGYDWFSLIQLTISILNSNQNSNFQFPVAIFCSFFQEILFWCWEGLCFQFLITSFLIFSLKTQSFLHIRLRFSSLYFNILF